MQVITLAADATTGWDSVLAAGLAASAALVFGYRFYRYRRGGPIADVWGGAILAVLLVGLALLVLGGTGWARWPAFAYGVAFALIVMPVWTLGVLLPLQPGPVDYAFTAAYWSSLILIAVAALAV